jgi:hypothetical protein
MPADNHAYRNNKAIGDAKATAGVSSLGWYDYDMDGGLCLLNGRISPIIRDPPVPHDAG